MQTFLPPHTPNLPTPGAHDHTIWFWLSHIMLVDIHPRPVLVGFKKFVCMCVCD